MNGPRVPVPQSMDVWEVAAPARLEDEPLRRARRRVPEPGPRQVLVEVSVCGVCRTDLHVVEGDLPVHRSPVVPGHEIVGRVVATGRDAVRFSLGERIGIAWLGSTCGTCSFCTGGGENLCIAPRFTGWDLDGGYAQYSLVDQAYAYRIPDVFSDAEAAPLLCAGIIGYRALRRSRVKPGGRLGLYGFGGSAHLAAQVALFQGCEVHVLTRSAEARSLALRLGASSAGDASASPPVKLDGAILFAPVGDLVPVALEALDPGGVLAVAGIHLSDIPVLDYQRHLFQERSLCSVTANTRRDGEEFLAVAAQIPIRPTTVAYPFERAPDALADLAADRFSGAAVLEIAGAIPGT